MYYFRYELLVAKSRNCHQIELEGDSAFIIKCDKIHAIFWKLKSLIRNIKALADYFNNISFSHTFSEPNFVADTLVLIGHSLCSPSVGLMRFPLKLIKFMLNVLNGSSLYLKKKKKKQNQEKRNPENRSKDSDNWQLTPPSLTLFPYKISPSFKFPQKRYSCFSLLQAKPKTFPPCFCHYSKPQSQS